MIVILMGVALIGPPNAHAQGAAHDGATMDGGGLPTPDEIASHIRTVPTVSTIINRILSTNQNARRITSMDFEASLRVKRPLSAPPNCVFQGAVTLREGGRSVVITRQTLGLTCWAANRFYISKLFESSEPFAALLARFEFKALGVKVVSGAQYYLVQGKARESTDDPKEIIGWVDYDRGLVIEAKMQYALRAVELEQRYTSIAGAWVLTHEYLNIPSLESTIDISYSEIALGSVPTFRVTSGKYRCLPDTCFSLPNFVDQETLSPISGRTVAELRRPTPKAQSFRQRGTRDRCLNLGHRRELLPKTRGA